MLAQDKKVVAVEESVLSDRLWVHALLSSLTVL